MSVTGTLAFRAAGRSRVGGSFLWIGLEKPAC